MKDKRINKNMDKSFFNEMGYEIAGDVGAVDNDDMIYNKKFFI